MRQLTENALKVLQARYLIRGDKGSVAETPEQLFRRVANAVAAAETTEEDKAKWAQSFYELMANLDFLPNTPTLVNAGNPKGSSVLSACFVLPVKDSLDSIFNTLHRAAMLHQGGAGTGYSFSELRPANSIVSSRAGVSSGPISFMRVYNAAVEEIKQGGVRRGAQMNSLSCTHPDIIDFIRCKRDLSQITNANISVEITDAFMEAVEKDADWTLSHPKSTIVKTVKAKELWNEILESAWQTGDPGCLFIDEANRYNSTPHIGTFATTNPCGEIFLLPNEACNLGSINLVNFVDGKEFQWSRFRDTIHSSIRFLDDVIEISNLPFEDMNEMMHNNRKVGLGIMGWADLLLMLGISYNSEEALQLADVVSSFLNDEAKKASANLGQLKGNFPNYKGSIYDRDETPYMRNCDRTCIAPTGSISIIANETSSGIEPVFAFNYSSNRIDTKLAHSHWFAQKWAVEHPMEALPTYCVEANKIDPEWHVRMQAVWQKNINLSISKTVNLSTSATREDISKIYKLAWKLKCKGITIYRDGCRATGQVLETKESRAAMATLTPPTKPTKPAKAFGQSSSYYELRTGSGPLHVHIDHHDNNPYRVFVNMPPIGTEISGMAAILGVVVSKYLELGGDLKYLIKHFQSVTGDRPTGLGPNRILSVPHALSTVFKDFLKLTKGKEVVVAPVAPESLSCPECYSHEFKKQEGCSLCYSCGFSTCS